MNSPKFNIKTFGCQMNFSDSERIQTILESTGYILTQDITQADLVIFNTCGVRQMAEDRVYGQVHNLRLKKPNVEIVITGCVSQRKDVQRKLKEKVNLFLPIKNIEQLPEKLKLKKSEERLNKEVGEFKNYLKINPQYKKNESIFVPIMTGCNNFCSYCVVPYARGREWSRPYNEITKEIIDANKFSPLKEVTLLGQNVNSYNFSSKTGNNPEKIDFPLLLKKLAEKFPGITFEFLTSHPKDFSDELIEVIKQNKNVSRRIHLPIQSGSNKILEKMNRKYTREHYLKIIDKIKQSLPEVKLSTDVIIGFPGETEVDFQETVEIFKKVNYHKAYLNKYSPRPGTVAEKLGDSISWKEKKRREVELKEILEK